MSGLQGPIQRRGRFSAQAITQIHHRHRFSYTGECSPNTFTDFTFIGFELEKGKNVKPAADRPNRVWVYGKRSDYFDMGDSRFSWPEEWFARAHDDLSKEYPGFEFVGAIKEVKVEANPVNKYLVDKWQGHETVPAPAGIRNLGSTLPKDEFEREMGLSRAMLGVGWPRTSPSPYYALANGVPFINPVGTVLCR